jgi:Asp-tRNA(Asn)/Glu-tRNA(Gln) amidotransferase A subunit family amidase
MVGAISGTVGGGITAWEAWQWHQSLLQSHAAGYDPQVRMRIERGALLNEADAQLLYQQRADWRQRVEQAVAPFDGAVMPPRAFMVSSSASSDSGSSVSVAPCARSCASAWCHAWLTGYRYRRHSTVLA